MKKLFILLVLCCFTIFQGCEKEEILPDRLVNNSIEINQISELEKIYSVSFESVKQSFSGASLIELEDKLYSEIPKELFFNQKLANNIQVISGNLGQEEVYNYKVNLNNYLNNMPEKDYTVDEFKNQVLSFINSYYSSLKSSNLNENELEVLKDLSILQVNIIHSQMLERDFVESIPEVHIKLFK